MPSSSQAQPQWWQTAFMTRVLPFILFLILTTCQGRFGIASHFWFYALKTLIGIALIAWMWSQVQEMRWRMSWEACCVGLACFLLWVGLDGVIPRLGALWEILPRKTVAMESLRVLHGSSSFGVDVCRDSDHWLDTDCASSGGGFLSIGRLSLLGSTKYRIGAAEPLSLQSFFCDEHSLWCGASGMVGWYFLWCCLPMAGAPQRASRRRHDGPCDHQRSSGPLCGVDGFLAVLVESDQLGH